MVKTYNRKINCMRIIKRIIDSGYKPGSNLLLITLLVVFNTVSGQPQLILTPVITTGLDQPIQFVHAGDGSNRIFIVQKEGTIRAYDEDFNFLSDFLTVSGISSTGERGLLSMAFHPDYINNGLFFVYYTNTAGDLELARYQVSGDPNIADAGSKLVLITINHQPNSNHNGGELHFGNDGFLYLSTGDGGGAGDIPNNAQNTTVLLGKILRFDINTPVTAPYYSIPAGNPFGNEIFDLGLRNPYRWSFDRQTFDMWIGDVGQDSWEEINFRPAGSTGGVNFGWHCYEGNTTFNTTGCAPIASYVFPVHTYPTQNPSASITGGIVYRGNDFPILQGWYISADYYSGIFYKIISDGSGGWTVNEQTISPTGIVDFGETENGEAYVVSLTSNSVYRVSATTGSLPLTLLSFTGTPANSGVRLNWKTGMEDNVQHFDVEFSRDGTTFTAVGSVASANQPTGADYNYYHPVPENGDVFYRLKMMDIDGSYSYSGIIKVRLDSKTKPVVSPSIITNGRIQLQLQQDNHYTMMELIAANGAVIKRVSIGGLAGNVSIPVNQLNAGIYFVRLSGNSGNSVQKIYIR